MSRPLLAPPVPKFPVQFGSPLSSERSQDLSVVEWPEVSGHEDPRILTAVKEQATHGRARGGEDGIGAGEGKVEWGIKTEGEAYVSALESKLDRLSRASVVKPGRVNGRVNGVSREDGTRPPGPSLGHGYDEHDEVDYSGGYTDEGGYGLRMEDGIGGEEDSEVEGQGLLWDTNTTDDVSPSTSLVPRHEHDQTLATTPGSETDLLDHFPSPPPQTRLRVLPPTPEASAKRVSFSSSVRIARGIGSPSSATSVQSPSFPIPPPSSSNTLLSASPSTSTGAPASRTHSPNRSPHLSQSEFRPPSPIVPPSFFYSTSHHPRNSLSQLSLPHYFPSITRSSSPCSSIYAPLTESRTTFTSPMDIRPPIRRRPHSECSAANCPKARRSKRPRTWIEWFKGAGSYEGESNRGEDSACCDSMEDDRGNGDAEESGRAYRDLVEEQRRNYRRKKRRSLSNAWAPRGGSEDRGRGGWIERVFQSGSTSYGTFQSHPPTPIDTPSDRTPSESTSPSPMQSAIEIPREPITKRSKTATDVAFGRAPRRWVSWSWIVWKIKGFGNGSMGRWRGWRGSRRKAEHDGEEDRVYEAIA